MINKLIINLIAIEGTAKNVHYNIADYSIHLLADRIQDGLFDFIDELKENCLLAKGQKPLNSAYYYESASNIITDSISLQEIKRVIILTLQLLESFKDTSIGDSDLLGRIGSKLQNDLGVLNIVLGENK